MPTTTGTARSVLEESPSLSPLPAAVPEPSVAPEPSAASQAVSSAAVPPQTPQGSFVLPPSHTFSQSYAPLAQHTPSVSAPGPSHTPAQSVVPDAQHEESAKTVPGPEQTPLQSSAAPLSQ